MSYSLKYSEYNDGTCAVIGWSGTPVDVTIPLIYNNKKVTRIGYKAFENCESLISITIPDTVRTIDAHIFKGCYSLENIIMPFIGGQGFLGSLFGASYSSDNYRYVPETLKKITITAATRIDDYAFYECKLLTDIVLSNSIESIGERAFSKCASLSNIILPNTIPFLSNYIFYDCSSLTNIEIPNSVTSIGKSAFAYCSSLVDIKLSNNLMHISEEAFLNCSLNSIEISSTVTWIEKDAFRCELLKVNYLGSIDQWMQIEFENEFSNPLYSEAGLYINDVLITELITNIDFIKSYAFHNYKLLKSITLTNDNIQFNENVFEGCLIEKAIIPNACLYKLPIKTIQTLIINGSGDMPARTTSETFASLENLVIGPNISSIPSETFSQARNLLNIEIQSEIIFIGERAFFNNGNLESLTLFFNDNISNLSNDFLSAKDTLKNITILGGDIYKDAFLNMEAIESIRIGSDVNLIESEAFFIDSLSNLHFNKDENQNKYLPGIEDGQDLFVLVQSISENLLIHNETQKIAVGAIQMKLNNLCILFSQIKKFPYISFEGKTTETLTLTLVGEQEENQFVLKDLKDSFRLNIMNIKKLYIESQTENFNINKNFFNADEQQLEIEEFNIKGSKIDQTVNLTIEDGAFRNLSKNLISLIFDNSVVSDFKIVKEAYLINTKEKKIFQYFPKMDKDSENYYYKKINSFIIGENEPNIKIAATAFNNIKEGVFSLYFDESVINFEEGFENNLSENLKSVFIISKVELDLTKNNKIFQIDKNCHFYTNLNNKLFRFLVSNNDELLLLEKNQNNTALLKAFVNKDINLEKLIKVTEENGSDINIIVINESFFEYLNELSNDLSDKYLYLPISLKKIDLSENFSLCLNILYAGSQSRWEKIDGYNKLQNKETENDFYKIRYFSASKPNGNWDDYWGKTIQGFQLSSTDDNYYFQSPFFAINTKNGIEATSGVIGGLKLVDGKLYTTEILKEEEQEDETILVTFLHSGINSDEYVFFAGAQTTSEDSQLDNKKIEAAPFWIKNDGSFRMLNSWEAQNINGVSCLITMKGVTYSSIYTNSNQIDDGGIMPVSVVFYKIITNATVRTALTPSGIRYLINGTDADGNSYENVWWNSYTIGLPGSTEADSF